MDFINGKTIRDLWSERRSVSGDDRFLAFEAADGTKIEYTFEAFDELVNRTARAFHDNLGIESGDKVLIHLPNCPQYLQVWFALLKIGAVSVHSNVNHTAREIEYTADNADARVAITAPAHEGDVLDAVDGTAVEEIVFARVDDRRDYPTLAGVIEGVPPDPPSVDLAPEDTAQILFTSGTTSDPKGVVHTHANLVRVGERQSKHMAVRPSDTALTALPVFHVNAQGSVLMTLTSGGTLALLEEFETSAYVDQIRRHGATMTDLIGTQVRALLARPEREVDADNDLRLISFAINVTDEEREAFERRFDVPLVNGYGLTEAITTVSKTPIYGETRWPSIGRPTFDRDVHLVDERGDEVEVGEMGEIAVDGVRGETIMQGYYEMPAKTEEAFTEEGWLLTGDYGRFDEDGYLYFVDRKKNVIETRGENVSEAEVESVLENHPAVEEASVIGVPHDIYGEAVKAFVKPEGTDLDEDELHEYTEEHLAAFKVPEVIEFVKEFPRTSIGKIEKSTLREEER